MKLETLILLFVAGYIIYCQMQAYNKLSNEIKLLRLSNSATTTNTAPAPLVATAPTTLSTATPAIAPSVASSTVVPSSTAAPATADPNAPGAAAATGATTATLKNSLLETLTFMMQVGGEVAAAA